MENKDEMRIYSKFETIYFFAVNDRKNDIFKIGQTKNIINRLNNYN